MTTERSVIQMKLRATPEFLSRLEYLLVEHARSVLAEALNTTHHEERANHARLVVRFPSEYAQKASTMVAGGINITTETVYDEETEEVSLTATDAEFASQVATFWNALAGIETGT